MNAVHSLLSQMVNTAEGEKFKIGTNDTAKMDVYDFKKFVADRIKNGKIELTENPTSKKRKCIILILKKKTKT